MSINIRSRDIFESELSPIGSGQHTLMVDDDGLQLIIALLYQCRLGSSTPYGLAAYELITMIDNVFGDQFMEDAAGRVDLQVIIEDSSGTIVCETDDDHHASFEV